MTPFDAAVARYEKGSIHQRTIDLPDGRVGFHSETMLDREARQLRIRERFEIQRKDVQTSKVNEFVMSSGQTIRSSDGGTIIGLSRCSRNYAEAIAVRRSCRPLSYTRPTEGRWKIMN